MKDRFDFGEAVGIIADRVWYATIIEGHHLHARTYNFPVRIKFLPDYSVEGPRPGLANFNLAAFIRAARELEQEGVKAITCDCGLTADMQEAIADAVRVPVFTSNLLMVPVVLRMIGSSRKVGILTDDEEYLARDGGKILEGCGIPAESARIVIRGMTQSRHRQVWETKNIGIGAEEWAKWGFRPLPANARFDPEEVQTAIVAVAAELAGEHPDLGAIVLECTDMPLYSRAIREATGLPVFDSVSLVRYVHAAVAG